MLGSKKPQRVLLGGEDGIGMVGLLGLTGRSLTAKPAVGMVIEHGNGDSSIHS